MVSFPLGVQITSSSLSTLLQLLTRELMVFFCSPLLSFNQARNGFSCIFESPISSVGRAIQFDCAEAFVPSDLTSPNEMK